MQNIDSSELVQSGVPRVHGKTTAGDPFSGWITHLTGDVLVFELCSPNDILRSAEVIPEFHAQIEGRDVYSGRAVIRKFVDEGVSQRCEATIESGWMTRYPSGQMWNRPVVAEECRRFMNHLSDSSRIHPEFKVLVADMRVQLQEFRFWLTRIEAELAGATAAERVDAERELVNELASAFFPAFNHLFEKFELVAASIPEGAAAYHHRHIKQQLHPLLLCSPFAWRTFSKPLGYAGDYQMVNMILDAALVGRNLFAKVLNAWFISQPPAEAHRNRIKVLTETIEREALRQWSQGRKLKLLNLGCGPAAEIQRFMERSSLSEFVEFTLLDFNDETIAFAREALENCRKSAGRRVSISFIKKSVMQLLKAGERGALGNEFDLIYCAGLYDYLPDRVCRQLNDVYYDLLAPDGLLVTTNVDSSNPIRHMLDYVLEWHLIYRNSAEFIRLAPASAPAEAVKVYADITGVNIFMEVRRPRND